MDFYTVLIVATLLGFSLLAYMLLWPVYKFLDREQEASEKWTEDALAKRLRERQASTNGTEESESTSPDRPAPEQSSSPS